MVFRLQKAGSEVSKASSKAEEAMTVAKSSQWQAERLVL